MSPPLRTVSAWRSHPGCAELMGTRRSILPRCSLFERCAKAVQPKRGRWAQPGRVGSARLGLANHLPMVLEAGKNRKREEKISPQVFNNALQCPMLKMLATTISRYRYSSNANLAYGLMTRQARWNYAPHIVTGHIPRPRLAGAEA